MSISLSLSLPFAQCFRTRGKIRSKHIAIAFVGKARINYIMVRLKRMLSNRERPLRGIPRAGSPFSYEMTIEQRVEPLLYGLAVIIMLFDDPSVCQR